MRKWLKDRQYLKASVYVFIVAAALIIFEKVIGNMGSVADAFKRFLSFSVGIMAPFLYGFFIAYLFNPLVKQFDRLFKLIPRFNGNRFSRTASILLTFGVIGISITLAVRYISPEIISSFKKLRDTAEYYLDIISGRGVKITNE